MNPITVLSKKIHLSPYVCDEIKRGAHVIIEDNGAIYDEWHGRGTERAICQHKSSKNVFDVASTKGTVLIGTTHAGHTWIQWERSSYCTCSHCRDWIFFVCTRKNQGPEGMSTRIDSRPIRLKAIIF